MSANLIRFTKRKIFSETDNNKTNRLSDRISNYEKFIDYNKCNTPRGLHSKN